MKNIYLTLASILLVSLFATAQTKIYTPALRAPVDNASGQAPDATLDWDAVTGQGQTILYTLQLAQNVDFSDATTFEPTILTAVKMNELRFDEIYFWRVKATDGTLTSDWSAPYSFRVIPSPSITSPANQSTQNPDPLVKWTALTGVTYYDLQIDTAYSWAAEASGSTSQLNDVFEVDETIAWAVGNGGTILKRTSSGWESVTSGVTSNLLDVFFVDNSNGWAVGAAGTILYYNGTEWSAQTSGSTAQLNGVFFTSPTNGYAIGNAGAALKFNGTDWSSISTGITVDIYAIHGLDENHIWVTGKSGNLSFFNGSSWSTSIIFNRDMLGIWALAPDKIYTSAKAGRVYYYDGATWTEQASGSTRDLNDICFINETTGYAVGGQGTLVYFNGSIWGSIASGTTQNLFGINFSSESSGYFVGNTGVVVAFQGEGFNSAYLKNFSLAAPATEFQFANLLFGRNHYFRMRARHASDTSNWSSARSFTVVASPSLSKPANNATNIALDTLAQWDALTGVVRYTIQLSTNQDFDDPFTFETGANTYRFSGLSYGQDYYWRVNTRHAGGVSAWSEVFKFTTSNTVTLTSPADNATDVARLPKYEWQHIRGTEKYLLQVATSNSFADAVEYLASSNFYQTQALLTPNHSYFWRVRGIQGLDSTSWSNSRTYVTTAETSINSQNTQSFSVHPNPGNGLVAITIAKATLQMNVEIYTLIGKKVFSTTLSNVNSGYSEWFDLRDLGKGIYLIRLNDGKESVTRKLIVE